MKKFTKLFLPLVILALIFTLAACKEDDPTPDPPPRAAPSMYMMAAVTPTATPAARQER